MNSSKASSVAGGCDCPGETSAIYHVANLSDMWWEGRVYECGFLVSWVGLPSKLLSRQVKPVAVSPCEYRYR